MKAKDFTTLRRTEPFQPFRIRTKEGRTIDAVHRDLVMALQNYVIVGLPRKGTDKPIFETFARVNYSDIDQVELLDRNLSSKDANANGK